MAIPGTLVMPLNVGAANTMRPTGKCYHFPELYRPTLRSNIFCSGFKTVAPVEMAKSKRINAVLARATSLECSERAGVTAQSSHPRTICALLSSPVALQVLRQKQ